MFLETPLFAILGIVLLIFVAVIAFFANQYKRCPSNKIIVVYGKTGGNKTAKCVHGGGKYNV